jgi:uncharacterized membrane protein
MILYNTLMGVAAGLALILIPVLARKLYRRQRVSPEGWSLTFTILGVLLTFLGGLMAVTWPLTVNPPINIAFAEPTLVFGLLLLTAAWYLWSQRAVITTLATGSKKESDDAWATLMRVLSPVSWVVFALGLMMLSCTLAILRFNLVGSAPELEPISGLFNKYPVVENTFFGVLYGLSALGALLFPFALKANAFTLRRIMGVSLVIAGVIFLLFSVMNYYTHIGLLVNIAQEKNFRW